MIRFPRLEVREDNVMKISNTQLGNKREVCVSTTSRAANTFPANALCNYSTDYLQLVYVHWVLACQATKRYLFFEADWELLTPAYVVFAHLAGGTILEGFPTQRTLGSPARWNTVHSPQEKWWCGRKRDAVKSLVIAFSPPLLCRELVSQHSLRVTLLGKEELCLGLAALCPYRCFC